ncbi:MAG: hypothetical protein WAU62_12305 [Dehalococcoidales bacterium]
MATQVSLAIARVLQDGKWHPTAYFIAKTGYLIRPEVAYRTYRLPKGRVVSNEKRIESGRTKCVHMFLYKWSQRGHVQRRNLDSKTIEWKIADKKWLQTYLGEQFIPPFVPPLENGGTKSFDQLIDDLWLDFITNIEHRSAKDSFKEALVATIEWSKQKKGS